MDRLEQLRTRRAELVAGIDDVRRYSADKWLADDRVMDLRREITEIDAEIAAMEGAGRA